MTDCAPLIRKEQGDAFMTDYASLYPEELRELFASLGEPAFRAQQLFGWIHEKGAISFDEMTNLPKTLRARLAETGNLPVLTQTQRYISELDGTRKYVFTLSEGDAIESVLMRQSYGNSVCISSQVGCRMGCRFCASTLAGLRRNLTAGEMLAQVYRIEEDIAERVDHVVVMGTGEPLDNLDNLVRFVRLISHEKGKRLSERNITVSTCGLAPQIRRLAEEKLQITLALSLHAPNDALRRTMMPIANRYTIAETLAACDDYFAATGRRMSYEYSLVSGVNDQPEHARELAALLHGKNCHVNLIPINPIEERDYKTPTPQAALQFQKNLEKFGINATIRKKMGADIDSACGQLRLREKNGAS